MSLKPAQAWLPLHLPKIPGKRMIYPQSEHAMNNRKPDDDTARATRLFVERLRVNYPVQAALLFGSRARHTHRPDSDADVAVLLRGVAAPFLKTKLAMADVAFDILLETGIRIQPLPVWLSEWENPERYSNPTLLANIAHDGVPL